MRNSVLIYLTLFLVIHLAFGDDKCTDPGIFSCNDDCTGTRFCPGYNMDYVPINTCTPEKQTCMNSNDHKNAICSDKGDDSGFTACDATAPHPVDFTCTSAGLFPNIYKQCHSYYICAEAGQPAVSECTCPVGTLFDPTTLTCIDGVTCPVIDCSTPCGPIADDGHYFYVCANNLPLLYYCDEPFTANTDSCFCGSSSSGSRFNEMSGYQRNAECVTLTTTTTTTTPKPRNPKLALLTRRLKP